MLHSMSITFGLSEILNPKVDGTEKPEDFQEDVQVLVELSDQPNHASNNLDDYALAQERLGRK